MAENERKITSLLPDFHEPRTYFFIYFLFIYFIYFYLFGLELKIIENDPFAPYLLFMCPGPAISIFSWIMTGVNVPTPVTLIYDKGNVKIILLSIIALSFHHFFPQTGIDFAQTSRTAFLTCW